MQIIPITKVSNPYGWLSCMSPYPIQYEEKTLKTCEALFHYRRFDGYPKIQQEILQCPSPMGAKMIARRERALLQRGSMWDFADSDYSLMKECLILKLRQHPELKEKLLKTGNATIIEDCTTHDREAARVWGCVYDNGKWIGQNLFGQIWMEIRSELKKISMETINKSKENLL